MENTKLAIAGWHAKFDESGNAVSNEFFGVDGKPKRHADGHLGWRARYENDRKVERTDFGHDLATDGYGQFQALYDGKGNAIQASYLDSNGELMENTKHGIAGRHAEFDEAGNELSNWFFGVDEKPKHHLEGHLGWRARYENGRRVEKTDFGHDVATFGYAQYRWKYDEKGNAIEVSFLDSSGKLMENTKLAIAGWHAKFDEAGNAVSNEFFGVNGKPKRHAGGHLGWRARYENGRKVEKTDFGHDVETYGYAQSRWKYDEKGNAIELSYLDSNGELMENTKLAIAGRHAEFDEEGREIRIEFFGVDEKPKTHAEGHLGWKDRYEDGRKFERIFYGHDPQLWAYSQLLHRYDEAGNVVLVAYLNEQGRPTLNEEQVAAWRSTFDDKRNEVRREYLDTRGRVIANGISGYAIIEFQYDQEGQDVQRVYQDPKGAVIPTRVVVLNTPVGGQAEAIGLKPGDIVLSYNNVTGTMFDLTNERNRLMKLDDPPKTIPMKILRNGHELELKLAPGPIGVGWTDRAEGFTRLSP
jgi:hypothetical protein